MEKQFVVPELKLAGKADRIILGSGGGGGDLFGEEEIPNIEFADDESTTSDS